MTRSKDQVNGPAPTLRLQVDNVNEMVADSFENYTISFHSNTEDIYTT